MIAKNQPQGLLTGWALGQNRWNIFATDCVLKWANLFREHLTQRLIETVYFLRSRSKSMGWLGAPGIQVLPLRRKATCPYMDAFATSYRTITGWVLRGRVYQGCKRKVSSSSGLLNEKQKEREREDGKKVKNVKQEEELYAYKLSLIKVSKCNKLATERGLRTDAINQEAYTSNSAGGLSFSFFFLFFLFIFSLCWWTSWNERPVHRRSWSGQCKGHAAMITQFMIIR